jgi:hypothetical protein
MPVNEFSGVLAGTRIGFHIPLNCLLDAMVEAFSQ